MKHARFCPICYLAASVLLVFFSSCDDIFEEDISDKSVLIAYPSNGATITDNQLWIVWNKLEEAHSYHIAVVSPKFDNIQSYVCDILCDSLLNGYKLKQTLPNGDPAPKRDPNDGGSKTKTAIGVSAIGAGTAAVKSVTEGTKPQKTVSQQLPIQPEAKPLELERRNVWCDLFYSHSNETY